MKQDDAAARQDAHMVTPHQTAEVHMTRDELLRRLLGLLPAQFDVVPFRARIPPEYLPGSNAAQATRAMDAIRYFE